MRFSTLEREVLKLIDACEGRVGLVIASNDGKIEINHDEKFPSASLIKLPILIEGFRQFDRGLQDLHESIPISHTDRVEGSGVIHALSSDLDLKIIDLMTLMIIVSDNIATNLLIERLGMEQINKCMRFIGMKNSQLNRKMMDFAALKNGVDNYTTANDMIMCLKAIAEREYLTIESVEQSLRMMEKQQFKDKLAATISDEEMIVANKTGGLPGVEHDCAQFRYKDEVIYAAVLIDRLPYQSAGQQTLSSIGNLISAYIKKGN
ncbi:serine hydrolase [Bacillus sp. Bva_UNVM-123]|uniref:serine hydrolase n=1 Tax=Bacillus sp. Bva_UNVM-123 TaxID=2829798 RepID=UPI00391F84ED